MLQPALASETRHRGQLAVYQRPLGIELTHTEQFRRYTSQTSSTSNLKEADMKKINLGRVLLGGLVAGLVLNIGEFLLNGVVLADDMKSDFQRLNLTDPGGNFIAKAVVGTFILGIVIVFLYAAIRSQFGAGIKTAIYAGLFGWFFVYLYTGVIYSGMGMVAMKLFWIGLVWGLVEYALGAIAGAWLYKEAKA
jgi:hypothetical protein